MKDYIKDYVAYYDEGNVITANSMASTFLSREEFSKLNAEEFCELYLDTLIVAMHKIEERALKEKKENSIFRRK